MYNKTIQDANLHNGLTKPIVRYIMSPVMVANLKELYSKQRLIIIRPGLRLPELVNPENALSERIPELYQEYLEILEDLASKGKVVKDERIDGKEIVETYTGLGNEGNEIKAVIRSHDKERKTSSNISILISKNHQDKTTYYSLTINKANNGFHSIHESFTDTNGSIITTNYESKANGQPHATIRVFTGLPMVKDGSKLCITQEYFMNDGLFKPEEELTVKVTDPSLGKNPVIYYPRTRDFGIERLNGEASYGDIKDTMVKAGCTPVGFGFEKKLFTVVYSSGFIKDPQKDKLDFDSPYDVEVGECIELPRSIELGKEFNIHLAGDKNNPSARPYFTAVKRLPPQAIELSNIGIHGKGLFKKF